MQGVAEDIKLLAAAPDDAALGVCDLARRLQISQPNVRAILPD